MLIAIEGSDGAGKATQSRILADRLGAQLYSFPRYNTPIGSVLLRHLKGEIELREHSETVQMFDRPMKIMGPSSADPLAFQALMLADKCCAARQINNDLAAGRAVVCDRWIPSALCYGEADGIDPVLLHDMHVTLPKADLNIFIDVSPEEALRRRPEARDRYERDREKQKVVRANYAALWLLDDKRYVTVNGEGADEGMGPIESVAERIWKAVQARFGVVEVSAKS